MLTWTGQLYALSICEAVLLALSLSTMILLVMVLGENIDVVHPKGCKPREDNES